MEAQHQRNSSINGLPAFGQERYTTRYPAKQASSAVNIDHRHDVHSLIVELILQHFADIIIHCWEYVPSSLQ